MTNFRIPKELGAQRPRPCSLIPLSAVSTSSGTLTAVNSPALGGALEKDGTGSFDKLGDLGVQGIDSSDVDLLEPPHPRFATGKADPSPAKKSTKQTRQRPQSLALSDDSDTSDVSVDSIVDMYYLGVENASSSTALAAPGSGDGLMRSSSERARAATLGQLTGHNRSVSGDRVHQRSQTRQWHDADADDEDETPHALDYTNFDGDDDTPLPGEWRLSRRLVKEGRARRAQSRLTGSASKAKMELERRVRAGLGGIKGVAGEVSDVESRTKMPRSGALSPLSEGGEGDEDEGRDEVETRWRSNRASTISTAPLLALTSPLVSPGMTSPATPSSSAVLLPNAGRGFGLGSNVRWAGGGIQSSHSKPNPQALPQHHRQTQAPVYRERSSTLDGLVLDPVESRAMQAVSEWARPGRPRLARILADEVEAAAGPVVVACTRFHYSNISVI